MTAPTREENVGDFTRGLFRDAAPLDERITEAIRRITNGCGSMRIPAEATDPDIVLSDCRSEIAALRTRVEALTRDLDSLRLSRAVEIEDAVRAENEACEKAVSARLALLGRTVGFGPVRDEVRMCVNVIRERRFK